MSMQGYGIADIVRLTGLEESLIRFYESAFQCVLPPKIAVGTDLLFHPRSVDAFKRIHQVASSGRPVDLSELHRKLSDFADNINDQDTPQPTSVAPESSRVAQAPRLPSQLPPGAIVAVTSGKGGVGKSNVALNLSVQLRRMGNRVLLFDADLGTGNQHILAGLRPGPTLMDCLRSGAAIEDVIQEGPLGLAMVTSGSGFAELADLPPAIRHDFLRQIHAFTHAVDVLVIDTGTGIANSVIEFACTGDMLVVVTTPDITAITDAYGVIKTVAKHAPDMPVGVVVNMAPSAAMAKDVFERVQQCATSFLKMQLTYLGPVYRDPAVVRAVARRRPFVVEAPKSRAGRSLAHVCGNVLRKIEDLPVPRKVMVETSGFDTAMLGLDRSYAS